MDFNYTNFNMGDICKIWKKDGRLFETHSLTNSRSQLVAEAEAEMTQPEVVISNK